MAQVGSKVTNQLYALLTGSNGLPAAVSAIGVLDGVQLPVFSSDQVTALNVAQEIVEHSTAVRYPSLYAYCSKVVNLQQEKFRTFSGEAQMVVEVRVSHDRLDGLDTVCQYYVDATTRVLDLNRGDWGGGVSYNGGYEITNGPVKQGGRNFLQIAKISFSVEVSIN